MRRQLYHRCVFFFLTEPHWHCSPSTLIKCFLSCFSRTIYLGNAFLCSSASGLHTFSDLKAEKKSRKACVCTRVCLCVFVCDGCSHYIPATWTLKCSGVSSSHELLSRSLVFSPGSLKCRWLCTYSPLLSFSCAFPRNSREYFKIVKAMLWCLLLGFARHRDMSASTGRFCTRSYKCR